MAFSFGQPSQATSNPLQPSSGFSFGGSIAQKPQASGSGFSFGAPSQPQQQQPATGGGLFGEQNNAQQPQQQQQQAVNFGSSLFGNQGQQQPQPQTNSLFGNSTNNATGSSLFANNQQQSQAKPTFPFGNNNASTSTNPNPLTLSQLGTQPSYQQQQNKPLQQSTGVLGGAGSSTSGPNTRENNPQKRLGIPVNEKLEAIRAAWDVRDIQACRFLVRFKL